MLRTRTRGRYSPVMFMLHGRLSARPGMRDDLLAVITEAESAEPMPGCRLYLVAVDDTDLDGVWVTEVWETEQAHRNSLQLEQVKARIARAMPLLDPEGFRQQHLDVRAGIPAR